jgi:peroxiredoxin
MFRYFLPILLPGLALAGPADDAWQALTELDAGPRQKPKTPAELPGIVVAHLAQQEQAARNFLRDFADDSRAFEARLRLARVLQFQRDVRDENVRAPEIEALLREAERLATKEQRPEVEFARLSYTMRAMREPSAKEREQLLDAARAFHARHPHDRRVAPLFAEVATLFDLDIKTKRALLLTAQTHARDEELKARIADDLRRIDLLGQPVPLRFAPERGAVIDLADHHGKAVVLVFFAAWSQPSIDALGALRQATAALPKEQVQFLGVSLDTKREPLEALALEQKIDWPVICDGQGWASPLVRGLGINALPTVWVLDRAGRLRSLNGLVNTAAQVKDALARR